MNEIRILQVGLGPLGLKIASYIREREGLCTVAAVDIDPALAGRDLGELAGGAPLGVSVCASPGEALAGAAADVALVTTVSGVDALAAQIEPVLAAGLPVVSTCEELAYPWDEHPDAAGRIDAVARAAGVAVLGTGVNPGFLMDILPVVLTAPCRKVDAIRVERVQDASSRRIPFQKKIGAGLSPDAFEARRCEGTLRHVGLAESVQMIAARLGWTLEKTEDVLTPVIAEADFTVDGRSAPAGHARGVQQIGRGWVGGVERITLLFRAAVGEPGPHDSVAIEGEPAFRSVIDGGVHGDVATCAISLNAIPQVLCARPGLRTMADIAPPSWFARPPAPRG